MSSSSRHRPTPRPVRILAIFACLILGMLVLPRPAAAAPTGGSASGQLSTQSGSSGDSSGSDFEFPEVVVAGNAVSFLAPLQVGIVGYLPKARFAFQYDRQIRKAHWIYVGAGILADRGSWENFRMDSCGLENTSGFNPSEKCNRGGVVGFDLYAGYAHKFYVHAHPYVVPIVRGSLGFSWWALPRVGGGVEAREQARTRSWTLNLRPGGGVRLFLLSELALGVDINLPLGFLIHKETPLSGDEDRKGAFLLGIEILPLIVEYRF